MNSIIACDCNESTFPSLHLIISGFLFATAVIRLLFQIRQQTARAKSDTHPGLGGVHRAGPRCKAGVQGQKVQVASRGNRGPLAKGV